MVRTDASSEASPMLHGSETFNLAEGDAITALTQHDSGSDENVSSPSSGGAYEPHTTKMVVTRIN